jgi:hypothetical protein
VSLQIDGITFQRLGRKSLPRRPPTALHSTEAPEPLACHGLFLSSKWRGTMVFGIRPINRIHLFCAFDFE